MGYKSKFKGAEIDARLEKMVNVTYAELKALRDEGKLIAGQMYRMTDYETTCTWENTQVAGHPFDLVLTALDNKTLDEKCSAIWSERDKDGYFANSNLAAWDVRYCLDNDKGRFGWAQQGGKYLVADFSKFGMPSISATLDGKMVYNGITYIKWNAGFSGGTTILLLTASETPKDGDEIIVYLLESQMAMGVVPFVSLGTAVDGKGVIYRMADEVENDVPYDFKNIMFKRPLTNGKYDAENGVDTFCYTFCCIDGDTYAIEDQSVTEPHYCYNNKFDVYCFDNVFLTFSGDFCASNTFGDNCTSNTFGDHCHSNTFGDHCHSNTFGDHCHSNTFGYNCYRNEFGNDCSGNIVGAESYDNILGDTCLRNTLGSYSSSNTLGQHCYDNIFGQDTYDNTLGDYCFSNTFLNNCHYNTFENNETASEENMIQYYKVDCVNNNKIDVFRGRNYQTFVTTNSSGYVAEYTVDSIVTNSNTPK